MKRVCPIGSIPYEIKPGDTLGNIAVQFMTTVETILKSNPELNPNNIIPGQIICISEETPKVTHCPEMNIYVINKGDTFVSIAAKLGIPLKALIEANKTINPNNLSINAIICLPLVPSPYIIVINTIEKELNLYHLGRHYKTFEVAVGKNETPTPKGQFYIKNKQVNPGGPFGTRWMGLSEPHYGIHGTSRPDSIGKAISNGCIRLHNHDVEELFSLVTVNTPVNIY